MMICEDEVLNGMETRGDVVVVATWIGLDWTGRTGILRARASAMGSATRFSRASGDATWNRFRV